MIRVCTPHFGNRQSTRYSLQEETAVVLMLLRLSRSREGTVKDGKLAGKKALELTGKGDQDDLQ